MFYFIFKIQIGTVYPSTYICAISLVLFTASHTLWLHNSKDIDKAKEMWNVGNCSDG